MSLPVINGASGCIEQPATIRFHPTSGYSTLRRWECTSLDAANILYLQLAFAGYAVSRTAGPKPIVEAEFGGDPDKAEVPQDNYELSVNKVQKDLLDADHPLVNALNTTNRDEFREFTQDPSKFKDFAGFTEDAGAGGAASKDAVDYLWDLYSAGVRHIEVRQPVLRLNRFVSQNYNVEYAWANVGKLLTTASVKDQSGVPNTFLISIDTIVAAYSTPSRADGLEVDYGWFKEAPTLSQSGYAKIQIQQEFQFGLWDTRLYGTPI